MKAKTRLLWMKLHAYFACFFLPLTLVYITSGVLYLCDIKGGVTTTQTYTLAIENWPSEPEKAAEITDLALAKKQLPSLPTDYFADGDGHSWYGFKQEVMLQPSKDQQAAELTVKQHDFIHQMLLIHKGYAGLFFWGLGILLGASLLFSLLSGVLITLQLPQLKKYSIQWLILGTVSVITGFIIG